ncbi:reverse transcriptase family protein [Aeromonas veronii]|uniref:reverse transcriptase family protein n=1 Tax=Aeromonas veronii TaxID=654 RepID=UPI003441D119
MNMISNDFFTQVILNKDFSLYNSFSPSTEECKVADDVFFAIENNSHHKTINRKITNIVLSQQPVTSSACGFIKGKSYFDFLMPHISGYYFLRLDIKNFFHSIDERHVKALLSSLFSDEKEKRDQTTDKYSPFDIATLAVMHSVPDNSTCEDLKGRTILPIGFPSSPIISNIIFRKIDILIQKYCDERKIKYTRYADDLLFSSFDNKFIHGTQFEQEISILVSLLGLRLNNKKRVARENTISLNGYVIQNRKKTKSFFNVLTEQPIGSIRLSDKKIKIIKKLIHSLEHNHTPVEIMRALFDVNINTHKFKHRKNYSFFEKYAKDQLLNKMRGYRSYLISIVSYNKKNPCVSPLEINKYIGLVNRLNRQIIKSSVANLVDDDVTTLSDAII